jgi:hypothetical protein
LHGGATGKLDIPGAGVQSGASFTRNPSLRRASHHASVWQQVRAAGSQRAPRCCWVPAGPSCCHHTIVGQQLTALGAASGPHAVVWGACGVLLLRAHRMTKTHF